MDVTCDESSERGERVQVLEFWRAVEIFSARPLPRPDARFRITDVTAGRPMPWEPGSQFGAPPPAGKAWRHEVFGGIFDLNGVRDVLTGLYGPDADGGQREPGGGQSALFACTVDGDGVLVPHTAVLSSCAWAVGRALAAPDEPSLAGFGLDVREFGGELGKLADVTAEATDLLVAGIRPAGAGDPGDLRSRALRGEDLRRLAAQLAERLGVTKELRPRGLRVRSYLVDADQADEHTAPSFLNSFYADDLTRLAAAVTDGEAGAGLTAYLTGSARIDGRHRTDVRARPDLVRDGCQPARIPAGRWPADFDRSLALSQQFAVNEIMARLGDAPGLLSVNGPPGTGKTTLLRDLVAAIVVSRAERLADLASPAEAFEAGSADRWQSGGVRHAVTPLNPALAGSEIVVASSNNGAVENITAEIPGPDGIGAQWREAAARIDYFTATARLVHGDGAWAMIAARLGNAANRRAFAERFWWGAPGRQDGCLVDLLGGLAGRPVDWDAARDEFRAARRKVAALAAERAQAALALSRLPVLRRDAGTAYDAITAADDTLRALAAERVDAERSLRAAWSRYGVLVKARDAHAQTKPGLPALITARFGASREWRTRQVEFDHALRNCAAPVDAAQRAVTKLQARFAATVRARAEAVATLRRLTAECAVAQKAIAQARERWGGHFPGGPEFSAAPSEAGAVAGRELVAPWADEEFAAARTELFLAALALHKALIAAQARRIRRNLNALVDFLSGKGRPGGRALLAAWQTLFLAVPVVSTTFASLPAMFGGLGPESIGWLLIDEAGQAPPQQAAGAIFRARRTVVVGDPMQLEPVVTLPWGGQQALLHLFGVPEEWAPSRTSAQRVADRLTRVGTLVSGGAPEGAPPVWVGMPLRVHRRCDRPMFEVSNEIAYGGLMVFGTRDSGPFSGQDRWFDVRSGEQRGHWVLAEGERLRELLHELLASGIDVSQVRVLSPFRQVAAEAAVVHREVFGEACSADDRRKWVGTVHTMQGKEADVVILVLGGGPGGAAARAFATQTPNLLNVAVTRARRRLYVIGDHASWAAEPYFDVLARHLSVLPAAPGWAMPARPRQAGADRWENGNGA